MNNKNGKTLPIGLQIICGKNEDEKAVEIALALENYLGEPQLPDVSKFFIIFRFMKTNSNIKKITFLS